MEDKTGLVNREVLAALAMLALLNNRAPGWDAETYAMLAVDCADELLLRLERPSKVRAKKA